MRRRTRLLVLLLVLLLVGTLVGCNTRGTIEATVINAQGRPVNAFIRIGSLIPNPFRGGVPAIAMTTGHDGVHSELRNGGPYRVSASGRAVSSVQDVILVPGTTVTVRLVVDASSL